MEVEQTATRQVFLDWCKEHYAERVGDRVIERLRPYLDRPVTPNLMSTLIGEARRELLHAVQRGEIEASEVPASIELFEWRTGSYCLMCNRTEVPVWRRR